VLRDRPADILDPQALAKRHDTYRYRVLMGPTYRADMWALLEGAVPLRIRARAQSLWIICDRLACQARPRPHRRLPGPPTRPSARLTDAT
jgi:hypothetical protein